MGLVGGGWVKITPEGNSLILALFELHENNRLLSTLVELCAAAHPRAYSDTGYIHINVQGYTIYVSFSINVQKVHNTWFHTYNVQKVRNMCFWEWFEGRAPGPEGPWITAIYFVGVLLVFSSRRGWAVRWAVSVATQGMLWSNGRDIKVLCVVIRDGAFHPNRSKI